MGFVITIIIICAVLLAVLWKLATAYYRWCNSPLNAIPGPPRTSFLLGCFTEIQKEPFMEPHLRWWKQVGNNDTPMIHYTSILGQHNLVILDKEIIRTILTAPEGKKGDPNPPRFRKPEGLLRHRIGDGLVTLEGSDWMRHRRIIQPSFHTNFLRKRLSEVVPPFVDQFIGLWKSLAQGQEEIDLALHFSALTLDIVGIVLFSHEFHSVKSLEKSSHQTNGDGKQQQQNEDFFISAFMEALNFNILTTVLVLSQLDFLDPLINPPVRRSTRALNRAVDQVIANAAQQQVPSDNPNSQSMLQLLLKAQDEDGQKLNWTELRDETKTFLMAGHETTSTWLYWTMYALAKHPDVQERLYQEIIKCNDDINKDNETNKDDHNQIDLTVVERMEYLYAVLQEVLRLFSPVGMMLRNNSVEENFAGCTVPANTRLVLSMFLLHRHPKYWDDPDSFRPERWLNVSAEDTERRKFAFFPFSAGARSCIGQKFAMVEAQLIVVRVVQAFVIQLAPSQRNVEHTFTNRITMKAKPSVKIVVKAR